MFDSLVENAVDFLKKSVLEIGKAPKYSLIHFCAALELFLKSRLLLEHWSLVVTRPDTADVSKFEKGDFQSVSMDEAITRLRNVCNEPVSIEAIRCFQGLRNHRNKLTHFFHSQYLGASTKTIQAIVSEECKAWFYLHDLLVRQWGKPFRKHGKEIETLNRSMHGLRQFLRAKYDALKLEIQAEIKNGKRFEKCVSCGFMAAGIAELGSPLFESNCRVCNADAHFLLIDCPNCKESIKIEDMGEGQCEKCDFAVDINYLMKEFAPYQDPKESSTIAYCSECEWTGTPTVIPFGDEYLCLFCLNSHDSVQNCGFCDSLCTGIDPVASSGFGCIVCEGSLALDHT